MYKSDHNLSVRLPWYRCCGSFARSTAIRKPIPDEQPVIKTTFCPGCAMLVVAPSVAAPNAPGEVRLCDVCVPVAKTGVFKLVSRL